MNVEKLFGFIVKNENWKSLGLMGFLSLVGLIILDSVLFAVAVFLLKIALFVGGLGLLLRAAYLVYPTFLDEFKKLGR